MDEAEPPRMIERKVMEDFLLELLSSDNYAAVVLALRMVPESTRIVTTEIALEMALQDRRFAKEAADGIAARAGNTDI